MPWAHRVRRGFCAGIAGMIDFLRGMGERFLALGYSTPFLEMGSTYMYSDLHAARDAVRCVCLSLCWTPCPLPLDGALSACRAAAWATRSQSMAYQRRCAP